MTISSEGVPRAGTNGFGRRQTTQPTALTWSPPAGLIWLSLVNTLFGVITLGIYHFWGRTEVRKRIWAAIRIEGEPLSYTGTGKELLIGFLFVFAIVLIPALVIPLVFGALLGQAGLGLAQLIIYVGFIYLYGVAVYRALRYRLSRTRWRGIRGAMAGSSARYAWTSLWTALLVPFTLGWIYPWRAARLQRLLVDDMRFGDRPFSFNENPGPLYGRFIALWILVIVALVGLGAGIGAIAATHTIRATLKTKPQLDPQGAAMSLALTLAFYLFALVITSWYRAGQFNHFAASTSFEGVPLKGTMTGIGVMGLTVTNFLLVLGSLGILAPVAQARAARYFLTSLSFDGPINFDAITQAAGEPKGSGEGLAQAFDFDAF